jgi:hypothetical protein
LNEERRFRLYSRAIDGFFPLARTGLIIVALIWLGAFARDVLVAFAGKETAANLAISLIMKLQLDRWIAYLVGAGGLGYGALQRRQRQRTISRLTSHTAELETRLHPSRTSSGLTPEGRTRREDR